MITDLLRVLDAAFARERNTSLRLRPENASAPSRRKDRRETPSQYRRLCPGMVSMASVSLSTVSCTVPVIVTLDDFESMNADTEDVTVAANQELDAGFTDGSLNPAWIA